MRIPGGRKQTADWAKAARLHWAVPVAAACPRALQAVSEKEEQESAWRGVNHGEFPTYISGTHTMAESECVRKKPYLALLCLVWRWHLRQPVTRHVPPSFSEKQQELRSRMDVSYATHPF